MIQKVKLVVDENNIVRKVFVDDVDYSNSAFSVSYEYEVQSLPIFTLKLHVKEIEIERVSSDRQET